MACILILEDDRALNRGIQIALIKDKHAVVSAYTFEEGKEYFDKLPIDLFLLDVNLPDQSGLEFCRMIRRSDNRPIIFLTARDGEEEMLKGYQAGCDDYIVKPFPLEVLRKKVEAVLRRARNMPGIGQRIFRYKDLTIDFDRMRVQIGKEECHLTATEYKLLEYMAENQGKILTRSMLLEHIWDMDEQYIDENTLSVHIRRLRQKLGDDSKNPEYILTVFGIGYTFGE